jgi:hypothetical protein
MIRNIIIGVAAGLVTLWIWDRYVENRMRGNGGEGLIARVTRLFSSPGRKDGTFPINSAVAAAESPTVGGCSCS